MMQGNDAIGPKTWLAVQCRKLREENDRLRRQRDKARAQSSVRGQLIDQRNAERDNLIKARDRARKERDSLRADRDCLLLFVRAAYRALEIRGDLGVVKLGRTMITTITTKGARANAAAILRTALGGDDE